MIQFFVDDDGGEPIDHYLVERMDTSTGRWVPVGTTKSPNMDVTGLNEGKDYMFRVKAVNSEGESEPLETDTATTAKNPYQEPDRPGKPSKFIVKCFQVNACRASSMIINIILQMSKIGIKILLIFNGLHQNQVCLTFRILILGR